MGKTTLGENLIAETALDGYPVGYFSQTYKSMQEVWRNLLEIFAPLIENVVDISTKDEQENRIELSTGGVIELWSLERPRSIRGRKYKRVIIDEVAFIKGLKRAWTSIIRPTLADYRGDAWFFSNPGDEGEDSDYFEELFNRGNDPSWKNWKSWQMPTAANPYIDPEEIEEARRELLATPDVFEREWEAKFSRGTKSFLPSMAIWDSRQADFPTLDKKTPLVMGVDGATTNDNFAISLVARVDENVIAERLTRIYVPGGVPLDFNEIQGFIEELCTLYYVVTIMYDPFQLHQMMTSIQAKGKAWVQEFHQSSRRPKADKQLLDLIVGGKFVHSGNEMLRQHVENANKVVATDGKIRIVKKNDKQKIDGVVALSMAVDGLMELNL